MLLLHHQSFLSVSFRTVFMSTTSSGSTSKLPRPALDYRWVHAGAQHLDLPIAPITASTTSYKPFSPEESARIEAKWVAMSEEERRTALSEWGRTEGEGAPARSGVKKEKEKERRGSNASARSGQEGEVLRSGEEQPHDEVDLDGRYKDIMAKAQKEYENLELISGVPVSQVSRSGPGAGRTDGQRTHYSKSRCAPFHFTQRSGRIPAHVCR